MSQATEVIPSCQEDLLTKDVKTLSEAEMLAIVLQQGGKFGPAIRLSKLLLHEFGGLRPMLSADPRKLARLRGVNPARLAALRALPELARRYLEASLPVGEAIRSPADTETFLMARLRDRPHEVFCCLYLDNRHRVLLFEEMFRGTIDGTSVYPREVVKQALAVNAAAVILAHNQYLEAKALFLFDRSWHIWT